MATYFFLLGLYFGTRLQRGLAWLRPLQAEDARLAPLLLMPLPYQAMEATGEDAIFTPEPLKVILLMVLALVLGALMARKIDRSPTKPEAEVPEQVPPSQPPAG